MIQYDTLKLSFVWDFHNKKRWTIKYYICSYLEIKLCDKNSRKIYFSSCNKQFSCYWTKFFVTNHISNHIIKRLLIHYIFCLKSVFHWQYLMVYIFSISLTFGTCCIMSQWDDFIVKNAALSLHILSRHFFFVFHQKSCVLSFSFFFNEVLNFRNRISTHQKLKQVIRNCQQNFMKVVLFNLFINILHTI